MDDSSRRLGAATDDLRAALVVAHPGHELLVHGWLERARPLVFVITDGSGRSEQSRLGSTTGILERAGARRGDIYGRLTDVAAYSALLKREFDLFLGLAAELAEALVGERIDYVAGDAVEGYNPMHDVCRLVINAAVSVASRAGGRRVTNFEFSPLGRACAGAEEPHAEVIRLRLSEEAFERKLAAARGYTELAGEVFAALDRSPVDAFRVECLCPAGGGGGNFRRGDEPPYYELYGERQVAAGHYRQVLRYGEHIAPLSEALRRFARSDI